MTPFRCPRCGDVAFGLGAERGRIQISCRTPDCRFEWHLAIVGRLPTAGELDATPVTVTPSGLAVEILGKAGRLR